MAESCQMSDVFAAGPLQESAVWIDETSSFNTAFSRSRAASPVAQQDTDDPLGISDESSE